MARFGTIGTQYFDDAGDPLVSGKIYFYEVGTTTPKTTYADEGLQIANTNPVILTGAGRQPNIFFNGVAKAVLTKSDETQVEVRDPVGETASNFGSDWSSTRTYNAGDVVKGTDNQYYSSVTNNNVGNDPTLPSTADWVPLVGLAQYDEFTASGTWTKNTSARLVYIECVGGGGSGAAAAGGTTAGCGGSGGGFARRTMLASDLSATETVTVGAGGAAVASTADGNDGGNSLFGTHVTAPGGWRGRQGNSSFRLYAPPAGGNFFQLSIAALDQAPVYNENSGYGGPSSPLFSSSTSVDSSDAAKRAGGDTTYGGGGGGCAANGPIEGTGGVSELGGNGGNSSATAGVDAADGVAPGGGGGGHHGGSANSGAGANGIVRVWQW